MKLSFPTAAPAKISLEPPTQLFLSHPAMAPDASSTSADLTLPNHTVFDVLRFSRVRSIALPTNCQTDFVQTEETEGAFMEQQGTTQFFDHNSFYGPFFEDLERARGLVIIHSPYLSARQIERFESYFQKCIRRGVRVCVFVQEPADWNKRLKQWSSRFIKDLESAIQQLQSMRVHVTLRPRVHQKIAVVDEGILWNGSMNILSHFDTSECMERWCSREIVLQVIKTHRLDSCESCLALSSQALFFSPEMSQPERLQLIGRCVERRRREMGLSQGELAKAAGVRQNLISEIESGKRKVQMDTFDKILEVLQLQLLPVPWRLTRSMNEMLESSFQVDPTALIGIRE